MCDGDVIAMEEDSEVVALNSDREEEALAAELVRRYAREEAVGVFCWSSASSSAVLQDLTPMKCVAQAAIYRLSDLNLLLSSLLLASHSPYFFAPTLALALAPFACCFLINTTLLVRELCSSSSRMTSSGAQLCGQFVAYLLFPTIGARIRWRQQKARQQMSCEERQLLQYRTVVLSDGVTLFLVSCRLLQASALFIFHFYVAAHHRPVSGWLWWAWSSALLSAILSSLGLEDSLLRLQWSRGLLITLLWKAFSLSSRLLILSLCLLTSWPLFCALCFAHVTLSLAANCCRLRRRCLTPLLSLLHVVTDLNLNCRRASWERPLFQGCSLVEGVVVVSVWATHTPQYSAWTHYWLALTVYLLFFAGLLLCRCRHEYEHSRYYYAWPTKIKANGRLSTYVFNSCLGHPQYQ